MEPETLLHISIGLYTLMCLCMAGYLWLELRGLRDKLHQGEIGLAREAAERKRP